MKNKNKSLMCNIRFLPFCWIPGSVALFVHMWCQVLHNLHIMYSPNNTWRGILNLPRNNCLALAPHAEESNVSAIANLWLSSSNSSNETLSRMLTTLSKLQIGFSKVPSEPPHAYLLFKLPSYVVGIYRFRNTQYYIFPLVHHSY